MGPSGQWERGRRVCGMSGWLAGQAGQWEGEGDAGSARSRPGWAACWEGKGSWAREKGEALGRAGFQAGLGFLWVFFPFLFLFTLSFQI